MNRLAVSMAAPALLASAACAGQGDVSRPSGPLPVVVESIVDGDTITVDVGGTSERVRLTGIDTPEVARDAWNGRPARPAECYADEATAFLTRFIPPGSDVRIERDVVGRDDYGRLLAYVYRVHDDVFVNVELVRRGYAQPLSIGPNDTYAADFVEAARAAEAEHLGLWSTCT